MGKQRAYHAAKSNGDRKERKRARGRKRRRRSLFVVISLIALIVGVAVPALALIFLIATMPKVEIKDLPPIQTTVIYAADGRVVARLHGEQNRTVVPLANMPADLRNAVVSIEDNRFYEHEGVDFIGVGRAFLQDVQEGRVAQGASTITMQYVKEAFLTPEKTFARKLQQAMLALEVEKKYSKDKILEMYLNRIYFGRGSYGVEVAAETYYSKPVSKLQLHEAALLAGIIQRPEAYNPFGNPEAALRRRNVVLDSMVKFKKVDPQLAAAAKKMPLGLKDGRPEQITRVPHFVDYVKRDISKRYGSDAIFKNGLKIHTTIDLDMQAKAEKAVYGTLNRSGDPSGSMVVIDVKTGAIKAMVGGRDYRKSKFNLATQAQRQPGSSFKPIVLATAFNQKISAYSTFPAPGSMSLNYDGTKWRVSNFSDSKRTGRMNLVSATVFSVNTVYAQLILKVTPKKTVDMAHKLGIKSRLSQNPAIALGGTELCCTPLEMAGVYSTFARRGVQMDPWAVTKVLDANGALLEQHKTVAKRVLAQNDADTINSILQQAVRSGTGTRARISRAMAGKTGTAQNYRDAWFVGYTPDYAVSVWMGYPDRIKEMRNVHGIRVTGGSLPAMIWSKFMRSIIDDLPSSRFARPAMGGKVLSEGEVIDDEKKDDTTSTTAGNGATNTTSAGGGVTTTTSGGAPITTAPTTTSPPPTSPPTTPPPPTTSPPPTGP